MERNYDVKQKCLKATISFVLLKALLLVGPAVAHDASGRAASLLRSLQTADALSQPAIVRALEKLGADAVPSLVAVANAGDLFSRHRSIEILGRLGQEASPAVPDLIAALDDPEPQIRRNAAWALGRIGPAANDALPDLLGTSHDEEWDVRADAVWALGKIVGGNKADQGEIDQEIISRFINVLKDESLHVRWSGVWALARFGSSAETAVPALVSLLQDPVAKIRASAALSLARLALPDHGPIVVPALEAARFDQALIVQSRADAALRKFRQRSAPGM